MALSPRFLTLSPAQFRRPAMKFPSRRTMDSTIAAFLLSCLISFSKVSARTFTIANRCTYSVWPGILSNAGISPIEDSGFELQSGKSATLTAPTGWSGRVWGRTGCDFSSNGVGNCTSGNCGGKLQCSGTGADPPVTLIEFTLEGPASTQDFYDVSLVDGFNLPVMVTPKDSSNGTCKTAGCSIDMNIKCPTELQVTDNGGVVSCKSACLAFQLPQYCCSGAYANPNTCKPSNFSEIFKTACPTAYSYAFDDPSSIFTCTGADYDITFCPPASSGQAKRATVRGLMLGLMVYGAAVAGRNL